uniref:hypothetical protein n=1 Tax=Vibrio cholerae TaxID=666 RepID=UPI003F59016F
MAQYETTSEVTVQKVKVALPMWSKILEVEAYTFHSNWAVWLPKSTVAKVQFTWLY